MLEFFLRRQSLCEQNSLTDVMDRTYNNQFALEAAIVELTLGIEWKNNADVVEKCEGRFRRLAKIRVY